MARAVRIVSTKSSISTRSIWRAKAFSFASSFASFGSPSAAFPEVCATLTRTNPALASRLWGAPLGTLAPGALADLLVLDYDPVTPMETANALGHLVFGLAQAGVRSTVCGGRVLMEDGELCLDLDEAELRARCRAAARRVWARL